MVDHEVRRDERIHLVGRTAVPGHSDDRRPHGCQVDDGRNTGEVLEDDTARDEGNLLLLDIGCVVAGDALDVVLRDGAAVQIAESRLEKDLDRIREVLDTLECVETGYLTTAKGCLQRGACPERVVRHVSLSSMKTWAFVETN